MTVFLAPNASSTGALTVTKQAAAVLLASGANLVAAARLSEKLNGLPLRFLPEKEAFEACDIIVTIGGDGTLLHAARHNIGHQKPLIGINAGRLGFLAIIEKDEIEKLRRLPAGEYEVQNRSLLQFACEGLQDDGQADPFWNLAINDIVLFKQTPEKGIALDIFCDDIKVSGFRGDGVIFATPTGSTAYSMSAGGPVLDAALGGIIVTQICAHIVQTPPMVFAGNRELEVVSGGDEKERVVISCDGMQNHVLPPKAKVKIRQSLKTVPLIQFSDAGQLKSIDKKLKGR